MEERLLNLLADVCEDDIVKTQRNLNLVEEGLLDSLGYTELLVGIEEELGVLLAPSEIAREDVETANKIIALVKSRS
ncbi:MAG: D-alanine--poly(phosphoribitol) ligase subunit DltC [Clostridiales bacterium]|nr:D-alanine--poly(phosphoribitol) ligase subunit DltC [Clostridiales bacterium]